MGVKKLLVPVAVAGLVAVHRRGSSETPYPDERDTVPGTEMDAPAASEGGEALEGAEAGQPGEIGKAGWKQILKRAWKESKEDNVPLLAAGVAFFSFLALFPALIAMVSLYGLVADPQTVSEQINSLFRVLPAETASLVAEQLREITSREGQGLGIGFAVSLLVALFTASGGVANMMRAVNLAYDEEEARGLIRLRLTALGLTLGAVLFIVVAVGIMVGVPYLLERIGLGGLGTILALMGRWVGLVAFMLLGLAVLYRYAPDREDAQLRWVSVGAGLATALWLLGSAAFSLYVSNFGKYGATYGALAGVVVLMLWLFLTSYVVLLGAEVNAEAERQTRRDTTTGAPQPMGERGAYAADTYAGEAERQHPVGARI